MQICSWVCNGLYVYALRQQMPTEVYVRRLAQNSFQPEVTEKYIDSYIWMDYLMNEEKCRKNFAQIK